jgi:hypothetical protein
MATTRISGDLAVQGTSVTINAVPVSTTTGTETLTNKTLTSPVINSPTGIAKADVGLGNVDNTSDATKNAASVTLTNKTLTSPVVNSPTGIVKADVGLSNVDNTSDATKDAATATLTNKTMSTATNTFTGLVLSSEKGANSGVATLDAGGKVPVSQLPNAVMTYEGTWVASTNTPTLADGTGNAGMVYLATDAGTVNFGAGNITFAQGDWVVYSGSIWQKSSNSNSVVSVNGQTGVVVVTKSDVSLGNVDNTSDATKNSAVATLTNKTLTSPVINTPTGIVKGDVGLGNVDNTSDATKNAAAVSLTNHTIDASLNTISNITNTEVAAAAAISLTKLAAATASRALASDASGFIVASATTAVELGYVSGVTSAIQTQIGGKEPSITATTSADYYRGDKSFQPLNKAAVGLGNVDNTSDATKNSAAVSLTNHTIDAALNTVSNISNTEIKAAAAIALNKLAATTASKALVSDASGFVSASATTDTEIGYVAGVTSAIQTQLGNKLNKVVGDLEQISFAGAESASAANVTGAAFANANVRSFKAQISVTISATASLYEVFEMVAIQKGASWDMAYTSVGDISNVTFAVSNSGQITYSSSTYASFSSMTIKVRALVTSV